MSTLNDKTFTDASARIKSWRRPLLLTHTKPDGDALGSLVAMRAMLQGQGVEAQPVLFDPVPDRYSLFTEYEAMPVLGVDFQVDDLSDVDGVVVLDTCTYNQLDPLAEWIRTASVPRIAVDHHMTRDDLADLYVVDESAAANCLILYEWARIAAWPLDARARDALFVGIAMDTGWFRHSNSDGRALAAAADLAQSGTHPHELFQRLFLRETYGRVRLLGAALGEMELLQDGRLAVMTLRKGAFAQAGATPADTEDIVGEPLRIASVAVSVLVVDCGEGVVRMSFRSKAPLVADAPDVDVAEVARALGGGGHRRAAGARMTATVTAARQAVVDHLDGVFHRLDNRRS